MFRGDLVADFDAVVLGSEVDKSATNFLVEELLNISGVVGFFLG